jgi:probable O-glycosylation ligase (exosortase A-associated)
MRDIALALVFAGLMPVALFRPYVGALTFAVISLSNVHRLTWGFAFSQPWALIFALLTILGLATTRERAIGDSVKRYFPILLYLAWMCVTTAFAFERGEAVVQLEKVMKIHLMCVVTLSLLTTWPRIEYLAWASVCSIGFYGLKGGLFTLVNGGQFIVWGPKDSAISDNNHLAVGLVMLLPMMYWLYVQARRKWLKLLVAFSALMSAVSVFGSHSRSAFLGIAAMSLFMMAKSRHKLAIAALVVIGATILVPFMPQSYWNRMASIETYQQDTSAMGRINAWMTAIAIAKDRVTGGGFELYSPPVFARYAPNPTDIHSSHSIYFQALGEHGFIGLAMFLFILLYVWIQCRKVARLAPDTAEGRAQALLAKMIQVSMIGLMVGGAFVNIGNWDMVYYLAILAFGTARVVEAQARDTAKTPTAAGMMAPLSIAPVTPGIGSPPTLRNDAMSPHAHSR